MGIRCDMQLENPKLVYQPGDLVSGHIILTLEERELIKALAIKIAGYASTHWEKPLKEKKQKTPKDENEQLSHNNGKETVKPREAYTNREDYLSTTNYFKGSDSANSKIVEAGTYHYNFAVRLPLNCPSAFEAAYAHIRYELDVFIVYTEHRQSCYLRNIHVIRPFDLRNIIGLNQPHSIEVIEKKSLLKFWQRPLQLQVDVQRTGFIPGESISVHLKVLNYDLLTLTDITYKVNLVATLVGMLKNKAKLHITRSNVIRTVHSLFGQNGSVVQHLQNMQIPATPPTLGIADCRCIQISYEIEVEISTSTKNRNISAVIPITIGTISIANNQETMESRLTGSAPTLSMETVLTTKAEQNDAFAQASAPLAEESMEINGQSNILAPSTSFREAEFMSTSTMNKRKKHNKSLEQLDGFAPKYVYYNMQNENQQNITAPAEQTDIANYGVVNNEKTRF